MPVLEQVKPKSRSVGAIHMIAHCIFHQTPPRERARCETCGSELRAVSEAWYCPQCLCQREVENCPICEGRPWQ